MDDSRFSQIWLVFVSLATEGVCESASCCVVCHSVLFIYCLVGDFYLLLFVGGFHLGAVLGLKFRMCSFAPSYILYTFKEFAS